MGFSLYCLNHFISALWAVIISDKETIWFPKKRQENKQASKRKCHLVLKYTASKSF